MLVVVTPASSKRLTTLEAVKTELQIPVSDTTKDALLLNYIDQASGRIARECDRTFGEATYEETLPGYGRPQILLSETPVTQVVSVLIQGQAVTDYRLDQSAGMLYRQAGWPWTVSGRPGTIVSHPGDDLPLITVTYKAGFILPGAQNPTLPGELERACITLVKLMYKAQTRDPAITQERIGDYQAVYANGGLPTGPDDILARGLPADIAAVCLRWRRVV